MKPKKRIVFLAYSMAGGGLENQIASLTDAFADQDSFHVTLILWNNEIGFDTKIPLINLGIQFPGDSIWNKVRKYFFIKKYLQQEKVEIIIDLRHRTKPWLELFLTYFLFTIPTISTVHSIDLKAYGFKIPRLVPFIFNQNKHLVCVSTCVEHRIRQQFPKLPSVHTIYNLVNKPGKISENQKFTEKYILFVGRVDSLEKQVKELIKAYAQSGVYAQNVHLILLGGKQANQEFLNDVQTLNIENFVHFYPFQPNIALFYEHALFTVLCSQWEGFGLTLVESLLCQTPVVSFACDCGPSEIIFHEKNGLLVAPQDFEELALVIKRLVQNEQELLNLKANASFGLERFSKSIVMEHWSKLIHSL